MKIRPVGAELFHAHGRSDGRTYYMTKLIVTFRNFEKRLKISVNYYPSYYMGQRKEKNDKYQTIITSHPSDGYTSLPE